MPAANPLEPGMDVLSPRSTNVPMKPRINATKKVKVETKPKQDEKPHNPDRIDDTWRPPVLVTEPGSPPETYITGRKLGKGGFAVCFEGKTESKSEVFALKVVKACIEQKKMLEKFRTELQIHAKMSHPNIVEFHKAFTFGEHTYVILELCTNGNLTDMVKARSCLSLPEVRRFMIQICGGVKYMHRRSVIHRDLKMGNIFLDSRMDIKIGDFGLAAVMADEQDRRTTLCGTPNYIAPEILSKSSTRGHDNKVDTWAIGVICYAMLMGTPPFQSKTQQEIYTKLRTLEYEWKIDSKNYIPQPAKDFVASCLNLVSAERPEMDDLVEHEFFKMGAIAEVLEGSCLRVKPIWLENADPRGDRVRLGYGVDHSRICKEAGVGRTVDGRPRPAAGQKANISTLIEIEAENRQGCAPTIPLPEGVLYRQFVAGQSEWTEPPKRPLGVPQPRSRKTPIDILGMSNVLNAVQEIDLADTAPLRPASAQASAARVASMPRPAQSFAAQQRQQALASRTMSRPAEPPKRVTSSISPAKDDVQAPVSREYLRERPVRATSVRATRSKTNRQHPVETPIGLAKSDSIAAQLEQLAADPVVLARRDAPAASMAATTGRSASYFQRPGRSIRARLFEEDSSSRPPSASSASSSEVSARILRPTLANDRRAAAAGSDDEEKRPAVTTSNHLDSNQALNLLRMKPRLFSLSDKYTTINNSTITSSLASLRDLHDRLSSVPAKLAKPSAPRHRRRRSSLHHPRVDKWVDYSTRHGIAYILSDDTVGMVLKSSEDNSKPSGCVVMRNARAHTVRRARGTESQVIPQSDGPVEFYEPSGDDCEVKSLHVPGQVFKLDLEGTQDAATALTALMEKRKGAEAERAKVVGLLDKFGKYMNKVTESAGDDVEAIGNPEKRSSGLYIDFYQRLGNVGVWRFRGQDGETGLQFNFPDHTKLIVYERDGDWRVDIIHLDGEDARVLAKHGIMSGDAFERRCLSTFVIVEVLGGSTAEIDREVLRSNQVLEKLSWIRGVVGCWIKNGGTGRMGDEKVGWSGLQEKPREGKRVKLAWATVGRDGGDGDGAGKTVDEK